MLADQFIEAATSARTTAALDETARLAWRAHIEGHLSETQAQAISEAIAARRRAFAAGQAFQPPCPPNTGKRPSQARQEGALGRQKE